MSRRLLAGGVIAASVFAGGIGGALLFTPQLSDASVTATAATDAGPGRGRLGRVGDVLSTAATALGVTPAELRTAIRSGKSIAEVAKDKGVDVQKVIDALVSARSTRIDEAVTAGKLTQEQGTARKAELKSRVTAFVNGTRRHGGRRFGHGRRAEGASSTTGQHSSGQGTGTTS
jgi:hypothetical protein